MSLWEYNVTKKSYPILEEDKRVDTLIIGGGMTGVQTLYFLKDKKNVMLVEGANIGSGVSKNTTGKINYLQESTLGYLITKKKVTKAKMYLASQLEGIQMIKDIIKNEKIECNFETVTSYLVTKKEKHLKDLIQIRNFLKKLSLPLVDDFSSLDEKFLSGIGVTNTYVFHPLKYLYGLLSQINHPVYEQTRVIKLEKHHGEYMCFTNQGHHIYAKEVVVACHYPFFLIPYFLPIRTSIEKSYLSAFPVLENKKYTYITMESPSLSTRFYDNQGEIYQIFLSESHLTSLKQNDKEHFENLSKSISNEPILWSNVDVLTFDHMPIIGPIKKNLYLATGFHTWGMIESIVSAKMIAQNILGEVSAYQSIFSPKRFYFGQIISSIPYFFYNGFSFLRSKWYRKSWYSKRLTFFRKNGKLIACYRDEDEKTHYVHPVCPHMKCNLIFNEVEKTWDCPCHSSRFDLDGNVMKGPSKYSIYVDPDL